MKYKPPKCPVCEEPLKLVGESVYEVYEFDPDTGTYNLNEEESVMHSIDIYCENCGHEIKEPFPNGACNYQAEKE